jgi:hypothetical protein
MTTEMIVTGFGAVVVLLLTLAGFLFNRWMDSLKEGLKTEISALCQSNDKDHDDMWKRINRHGHKIKTENGGYATAGVIVEPMP